ncbi:hypothetical protein V8C86DRAFT_898853 [Haematococcus lacustris]
MDWLFTLLSCRRLAMLGPLHGSGLSMATGQPLSGAHSSNIARTGHEGVLGAQLGQEQGPQQGQEGDHCDAWTVVAQLQTLFHNMGVVNNWVNAYTYETRKHHKAEAHRALQMLKAEWQQVVDWMVECKLHEMLMCLANSLPLACVKN